MPHQLLKRTVRQDGALPLLASVCGFAFAAAAVGVTAKSRLLYHGPAQAGLLVLAVAGVGWVSGWWAFRALGFRRRTLSLRIAVTALVVAVAAVWGSTAVAAEIWKTPWQRYLDEVGGPGACLAGTPYGERHASAIVYPPRNASGPMEVWPGKGATIALRLNFDRAGAHRLTPADDASRSLMTDYGCR
nr:hypothetical protein KPHV_87470 [Kitasatospora purpeofusca]